MNVGFGTDGIRGRMNDGVSAAIALRLGIAIGEELTFDKWVVGRDTRISSPVLTNALIAGVASTGVQVIDLGVLPTAGVAKECIARNAGGAMITASHNPFFDNGIKLFSDQGEKLDRSVEILLEARLRSPSAADGTNGAEVGVIQHDEADSYERWLIERASRLSASHLRVGLDFAHGAASDIGARVFAATGAALSITGDEPSGLNINDGVGSTYPDHLAELVLSRGLDLGFAFDGDADRVVLIDESGAVCDGDDIMAILALDRKRRNVPNSDQVVATMWSNLGLRHSLASHDINLISCDVGDRAVALAMKDTGASLGGESSGHIIMADLLPAGDGLSTALEIVAALLSAGTSASKLRDTSIRKLPQDSRSIRVNNPPSAIVARLSSALDHYNEQFGEAGRVVLRASGTEPVVRILAEAENDEAALAAVASFEAKVKLADRDL